MALNEDTVDIPRKEGVAETSPSATRNEPVAGDATIRLPVGILDSLMNLIGEMVLVRNQVLQYSGWHEDPEFLKLSQRLNLVTSDLQDQVMKTRMQPIGNVVSKFQRLVRDLAKDLGKQIDLTVQGADTELDKTLLEAIKDPLTHIVRNSCDHGIETPEERVNAGKPSTGHLLISACHEGGQVIIEVFDDGRGLSREKILKKAIEKALIDQEKSTILSDREVWDLIFLPGFSTAEQVSSVSGRGVGMDIVRTNIEKIGGSVDLESIEGKGATIRFRIPLTLAIVPAMLVKSNGAIYAIPQVKLMELVRVEADRSNGSENKIQLLQGKPVYELRGKLLPLVDLRHVLEGENSKNDHQFTPKDSTINIVVLKAEESLFGLIVDEVLDTADIVVKPLIKFLKSLEIFSAATILGTGDIALIIDPVGIAKVAGVSLEHRKQEGAFAGQSTGLRSKSSDAQEYLLFTINTAGKYAVPLCMVCRLEEFSKAQVELSGEQPVIRYRDAILPLLDTDKALGFPRNANQWSGQIPTIVVQRSGKMFGMTVSSILDVTTVDAPIDDSLKDRVGVLGTLISGKEIITVVDALGMIELEVGRLVRGSGVKEPIKKGIAQTGKARPKVLHVEDVAFFRRQVAKLLTSNGFDVVTAEDGKVALELLRSTDVPEFALILSDIEMPRMNGYQFVKHARQIEKFKGLPMVALTTRFNQKDIEEGLQAGFDRYLEKLNPEVLMENIAALLAERRAKA